MEPRLQANSELRLFRYIHALGLPYRSGLTLMHNPDLYFGKTAEVISVLIKKLSELLTPSFLEKSDIS